MIVPGEYSPRKPTTSGRASACVVSNIPAPMVAASATAILSDIDLSTSAWHPSRRHQIPRKPLQSAGFAHAFLTACVNQQVSARLARGVRHRHREKMLGTK